MATIGLVGGCSAVKIGYNNLPELAYWWLDGYIDFTNAQTPPVREELTRLHQWHRTSELPRVAALLQKMQQLAPAEVSPAQVCELFDGIRDRLQAVSTQAQGGVVTAARTFSPDQFEHLQARFDKGNSAWRDEWMSGTPAERQERLLKSAVERAEQVYGTLEEAQLKVLRNSVENSLFEPQLNYTERLRRQQDMLQTLRDMSSSKTTPADATAALRAYLERSINSPNSVYRDYSERSRLNNCNNFAKLHNATTRQQREGAIRRLGAYERDFRELSAQQNAHAQNLVPNR